MKDKLTPQKVLGLARSLGIGLQNNQGAERRQRHTGITARKLGRCVGVATDDDIDGLTLLACALHDAGRTVYSVTFKRALARDEISKVHLSTGAFRVA